MKRILLIILSITLLISITACTAKEEGKTLTEPIAPTEIDNTTEQIKPTKDTTDTTIPTTETTQQTTPVVPQEPQETTNPTETTQTTKPTTTPTESTIPTETTTPPINEEELEKERIKEILLFYQDYFNGKQEVAGNSFSVEADGIKITSINCKDNSRVFSISRAGEIFQIIKTKNGEQYLRGESYWFSSESGKNEVWYKATNGEDFVKDFNIDGLMVEAEFENIKEIHYLNTKDGIDYLQLLIYEPSYQQDIFLTTCVDVNTKKIVKTSSNVRFIGTTEFFEDVDTCPINIPEHVESNEEDKINILSIMYDMLGVNE